MRSHLQKLSNCPSGLPPPCLGLWGQAADKQTTNKPESQQGNEPTDQETNKPTNQQGNKPTPQQARRAEMNPQTNQKTTKKSTKNQPKWLQNRSWRLSWAPLGASWGVLGPSWRQDGPKSQKSGNLSIRVTPLGGQVGSQNPSKIVPEAYQKVIIFLIACGVGFCCHLVPTWLQLGRQNPPQIQPSWLQDPSKNRSYGFLLARCPKYPKTLNLLTVLHF